MAKNQRDVTKIITKVMAVILAILMVLSIAGTLIYYIASMQK